jgi:hypothetical protein
VAGAVVVRAWVESGHGHVIDGCESSWTDVNYMADTAARSAVVHCRICITSLIGWEYPRERFAGEAVLVRRRVRGRIKPRRAGPWSRRRTIGDARETGSGVKRDGHQSCLKGDFLGAVVGPPNAFLKPAAVRHIG